MAGYTADFGTDARGSIPGRPSVMVNMKSCNVNVVELNVLQLLQDETTRSSLPRLLRLRAAAPLSHSVR